MINKILIIICTQVLIIYGEKGDPCVGKDTYGNQTHLLSYAEACKAFNCLNGVVHKECIELKRFADSTYATSPKTIFYEIGESFYFEIELPIYDQLYDNSIYSNLTYVHITLDPERNDVELYSPTSKESYVQFEIIPFISSIRFRGFINFYESLLPLIHGEIQPLKFTFSVGRYQDIVQRSVSINLVQKRCEHDGVVVASPGTFYELTCNQTEYPDFNTTSNSVLLRSCSKFGWDDERSQDFCNPLTDRANYIVQQDESNTVETVILLVVVTLLIFFAVMICYFVYKTFEELDDEDSSVDCGKNVDAEGNSFDKNDARSDAETSETSDDGKEEEDEEEPGDKEGASKNTSNDTAGSHYSRVEGKLKREPGQCKDKREPSLKIESSIPGTDPGEYKPKSIVHELAMLAKLRDTGDVTAEEFGHVKNIILYE